ncbi:ribbon-helix-helix protein, CopG family, partial [Staphylococcus aureus]
MVHFKKIEKRGVNLPRKTRLQISLTDKQIEELEKLAKEKGFTKSAILALALEEYSRKELE